MSEPVEIEVRSPNYCFPCDLETARAGLYTRFSRYTAQIANYLLHAWADSSLKDWTAAQQSAYYSLCQAFHDRFEKFASDDVDQFHEVLGVINTLNSLRQHMAEKLEC